MTYLLELCAVIILVLLAVITGLLAYIHRLNGPRWVAESPRYSRPQVVRPRQASQCCLEVPCSAQCADRRSALVFIGAADGARYGTEIRTMVEAAAPSPADQRD